MTARPEQFAALVAALADEMKTMDSATFAAVTHRPYRTADPVAFRGRPWVTQRVDRAAAMELTGHTRGTMTEYTRHQRLAGNKRIDRPPLPADDGTWETGELAIAKAVQKSEVIRLRRTKVSYRDFIGRTRELMAEYAARGERLTKRALERELAGELGKTSCLLALRAAGAYEGRPDHEALIREGRRLHARAAREGRPFRPADLAEGFAAKGWGNVTAREIRSVFRAAAGYGIADMERYVTTSETVYPASGGEGADVRDLVFASQVATACGVGQGALTHAVSRGELTPYWWTPPGAATPRMMLHPDRIELIEGRAGPVDKGWRPAPKTDGRVAANRKRAAEGTTHTRKRAG
jgi:hypothetical protein